MVEMRKLKTLNAYRSSFIVRVQDTIIFHKVEGLIDLKHRTNIGGVYFEVEQITDDQFSITSRIINKFTNAVKDYHYLNKQLETYYGVIELRTLWGRHRVRKTDNWIAFDVTIINDEFKFKARKEWEQNMYKVG